MRLGPAIKRLAIASGLYRTARGLARRVRGRERAYFQADVGFYRALLPECALCFDVGANIGEKSEALLRAGCRVVAVEPHPLVVPELRARCGWSPDWHLVVAAAGSRSAVATLYAHAAHGQSSLAPDWEEGRVIATFPVPVVTLDALADHFGRPDYCKLDVEGWELEVLLGLTHPVPLLSFEFHLTKRDIRKTDACLELLAAMGPAEVNVTPAERAEFHWPQWRPLADFPVWFPGELSRTLPGHPYGDIYVRRTGQQAGETAPVPH
jgi:FkbM family methyltransferase